MVKWACDLCQEKLQDLVFTLKSWGHVNDCWLTEGRWEGTGVSWNSGENTVCFHSVESNLCCDCVENKEQIFPLTSRLYGWNLPGWDKMEQMWLVWIQPTFSLWSDANMKQVVQCWHDLQLDNFFNIYFTLFQMHLREYNLFTTHLASLSELSIHLWFE